MVWGVMKDIPKNLQPFYKVFTAIVCPLTFYKALDYAPGSGLLVVYG